MVVEVHKNLSSTNISQKLGYLESELCDTSQLLIGIST